MNLASVDLNLLKALDVLLTERSVSQAAVRLGVGQSAMSKRLGRLRALFDDPLLVRTAAGMQPTTRALILGESVRRALATIERAFSDGPAFDPSETERAFRIAMADLHAALLLPRLIAELRVDAPRLSLIVPPLPRDQVAGELEAGRLDLAVTVLPDAPAAIARAELYRTHNVCVVSRKRRLAKGRLTLEAYVEAPHVLVSQVGDDRGVVDRKLDALGLARRVVLSVPHYLVVSSVVAESDCIATLPVHVAHAISDDARVRMVELPIDFDPFAPTLLWHRRNESDPALTWLRERMIEIGRNISQG